MLALTMTFGSVLVVPLAVFGALLGGLMLLLAVRYLDWALLVFMWLRPFSRLLPTFTVGEQAVAVDGFLSIGVVVACFLVLCLRPPPLFRRAHVRIFLAFLLLGLATLPQSTDWVFGARQLFRFSSYLVFFLAAYSIADERFIRRLINALIFVAAAMVVLGLVDAHQLIGGSSWKSYLISISGAGSFSARIAGFQGVPHTFANFFLLLTPVVLWRAWSANRRAYRAAYYALVLACLAMMLAAGVRDVMICSVIVMIVLFVGLRRYRMLLCGLTILVIAGFASGIFQARAARFLNPQARLEWNSMVEREETWHLVDLAIKERPLRGYGLGSSDSFIGQSPLKHSSHDVAAHCDYRKFAFELGVLGGLLYAGMWISFILAAWRRRGKGEYPPSREAYLCAVIAATGCAWMVIALVNQVFQSFLIISLWFILAGTAMKLANGPSSGGDGQQSPSTAEGERA